MIQFEAQITEKEYIKLNLNRIYRNPVIIIVMVGITLGIINLFVTGNFSVNNQSPPLQYLPVLLLVGFVGILPFSIRHTSKKHYKAYNGIHEKVLYTVSETGIHAKGQTFENTTNWDTLKSLTVDKNWVVLIKEGVVGIYIPFTAITSSNDLTSIVAMAKKAGVKIKGKVPA